MVLKTTK